MKTQFNLVTQWIADDGTQNTGSDERLISTHSTFADAQKALEKVQIRHPHNHAEIVEVDACVNAREGLADLFADGGELGYISIPELLENGAHLDLAFTPKPLSAI
jgi:hypothetical protein